MKDQPDDRMTGWNALANDLVKDLYETVKIWEKDGCLVGMDIKLCHKFDVCRKCPAGRIRFPQGNYDMCSALKEEYITFGDALELVEHEMDKRGMSYAAR